MYIHLVNSLGRQITRQIIDNDWTVFVLPSESQALKTKTGFLMP